MYVAYIITIYFANLKSMTYWWANFDVAFDMFMRDIKRSLLDNNIYIMQWIIISAQRIRGNRK